MNKAIRNYIDIYLPKTIRCCRENDGTLLALPFPYTVPCVGDMFQELYYWDTYFTNLGLLTLQQTEIAKHNVDNMLWLVEKYGFMPNGSRTYYLNRSQPPFLTQMVWDVYEVTHDTAWLRNAYETLKKEHRFWREKRRSANGLNAYTGYQTAEEDYDMLCEHFHRRTNLPLPKEMTTAQQREIVLATFSFFESGWDCNSRFLDQGHHFEAIDLNCLLYAAEERMSAIAAIVQPSEATQWCERAAVRKKAMQQLWDPAVSLFTDRHDQTGAFTSYRSAASFYPLFAKLATEEQAAKTIALLDDLLTPYGITAGVEEGSHGCQWDYPNIWAPLQWIVYKGLLTYGYTKQAEAVAARYCELIESRFAETGNFWEKYDGITGAVASNEYDAPPMMGWTAGVYIRFCSELGRL